MKQSPDPDFEAALRASLDAHAQHAPPGDPLAEQIIAATAAPQRTPVYRPQRSWGRFTLPAAAAVLAAIIGIVVAVVVYDPGTSNPPVAETTVAPPPNTSAPPSHRPTSGTATSASTSDTTAPTGPAPLHQVHLYDLSFTDTDDGWALASAQCLDGTAKRCTAIMRSTDGTTWTSHAGESPFNVADVDSCAAPCVDHLRFATDDIGYAYGPDALFMTTDGGATWQPQDGGGLALESADSNVVRLVRTKTGVQAQTAAIGSSVWRTRELVGSTGAGTSSVQLARNGADVYALLIGVDGGTLEQARAYRSSDDGGTWTAMQDPCQRLEGGQNWSTYVAAGDGGRVAFTCRTAQTAQAALVTSSNQGRSFTDRGAIPQREGLLAIGPRGTYLLALDGLSRTTDSGAHWNSVAGPAPGFVFLGFESEKVGRIVGNGGTTVWTTRNGGATWTEVALP